MCIPAAGGVQALASVAVAAPVVEKVLGHYPTFASNATDSNLRGYYVKLETQTELSYVRLVDMLDCSEVVGKYWSKKPFISSINVVCLWNPKPLTRYRQMLRDQQLRVREVHESTNFISSQSSNRYIPGPQNADA